MSYTKTTWATGDVVSSEKLNHLEQGVYDASNGTFIITVTPDTEADGGSCTADKTFAEVLDAYNNGKLPIVLFYSNPAFSEILYPYSIVNFSSTYGTAVFNAIVFTEIEERYYIESYMVMLVDSGSGDVATFVHTYKELT